MTGSSDLRVIPAVTRLTVYRRLYIFDKKIELYVRRSILAFFVIFALVCVLSEFFRVLGLHSGGVLASRGSLQLQKGVLRRVVAA